MLCFHIFPQTDERLIGMLLGRYSKIPNKDLSLRAYSGEPYSSCRVNRGERLPEGSSADDPADGPAFDIGWPGGRVKLPGGRPASAVSLLPPEVPPGLEESYASLVKGLLADGGGKKQTIGV